MCCVWLRGVTVRVYAEMFVCGGQVPGATKTVARRMNRVDTGDCMMGKSGFGNYIRERSREACTYCRSSPAGIRAVGSMCCSIINIPHRQTLVLGALLSETVVSRSGTGLR